MNTISLPPLRFLKENHISADLQSRVVRYIDMAMEVNRKKIGQSRVQSLNMLSGPLRVELQKERNEAEL